MSRRALNVGSLALFALSGITNVILLLVLLVKFIWPPACPEPSLQRQLGEDARMLGGQLAFPIDSTAYLSHVVMAMHESGGELRGLVKALGYWKRYPPCVYDGYPSNWAKAHVKMTFLFDGPPSAKFAQAVTDLYYDLPNAVRSCFAGMEVRHAGVQLGNVTRIDGEALKAVAQAERDMYSALLANRIGLDSPSHALLLTPDTIPVQADWMNLMDYETRIPVERFWMKGSIYRGPAVKSTHKDARSLITMSKVALYNIGDPAFGKFYSDVVRPFISTLSLDPDPASRLAPQMPVEHDFINYLFQFQHYRWTRMMVALFRPTDAIQDYSGAPIDLNRIQHDSPDTLIVKGLAPDLPPHSAPLP